MQMGCCILLIKDFDRTKPDTKIQKYKNTKYKLQEHKIQKLKITKIILLIKNFDPTKQQQELQKVADLSVMIFGNTSQKVVHEPPVLYYQHCYIRTVLSVCRLTAHCILNVECYQTNTMAFFYRL